MFFVMFPQVQSTEDRMKKNIYLHPYYFSYFIIMLSRSLVIYMESHERVVIGIYLYAYPQMLSASRTEC